MHWERLKGELIERAAAVGGLLRASPADRKVDGLDWSPAEVGAHLVSLPRRYRRMMERPEPFPASLSTMNAVEIRTVGCDDLDQLADLLVAEVDDLLEQLGDDGSRPVPFFGMEHSVAGLGGVLLGELLLHGLDRARPQERPWTITKKEAVAVLDGLLPAVGHTVDPGAAAKAAGTYHLRIRGGDDWTINVGDGDGMATVRRGRPVRADLHVSADPLAFLLVGFGRASRRRALLTGRMIGWGRKPQLAARFSSLFKET